MDNFNTLVKAKTLNQTCVKKIAARGAIILRPRVGPFILHVSIQDVVNVHFSIYQGLP